MAVSWPARFVCKNWLGLGNGFGHREGKPGLNREARYSVTVATVSLSKSRKVTDHRLGTSTIRRLKVLALPFGIAVNMQKWTFRDVFF